MLKYLLQTRVHGGSWETKTVAESRAEAAMAATSVARKLATNGGRHVGIRVVNDEDSHPRQSPRPRPLSRRVVLLADESQEAGWRRQIAVPAEHDAAGGERRTGE